MSGLLGRSQHEIKSITSQEKKSAHFPVLRNFRMSGSQRSTMRVQAQRHLQMGCPPREDGGHVAAE